MSVWFTDAMVLCIFGAMARPKSMDARKMISLPAGLAERIDEYRFANRLKTEAEAIRRLLELGLEAARNAQPETHTAERSRA